MKDPVMTFAFLLLIIAGISGLTCMITSCTTGTIPHDKYVFKVRSDFPKGK